MTNHQAGILAPIPAHAEYLYFDLKADIGNIDLQSCLLQLANLCDGERIVLGLSWRLCQRFQAKIPGLKEFSIASPVAEHSTSNSNAALWCWLRAEDRGQLFHLQRQILTATASCFTLHSHIPAFCHQGGRDLTGYEDGTENPVDQAALETAFVQNGGLDLDGSSFVVTQQWQHRFQVFEAMSNTAQDHTIGRRRTDNEELEEAPESAHVKRTAQEDFEPEAFVLRRSMPWVAEGEAGLMFVAFATSFEAFEAQFRRMLGNDDGIVDALFTISQPLNTHYFWCPPSESGQLKLEALFRINANQ